MLCMLVCVEILLPSLLDLSVNFCTAESVHTVSALLETLPISLYRRRQFEELHGRRYVWTLSPSHVSESLARFLQKTDSSHPTTQLFPLKKQLKTKTKRKNLKASRSFFSTVCAQLLSSSAFSKRSHGSSRFRVADGY